jgi:formylglycine-generating enzyme required for sulfatase activity
MKACSALIIQIPLLLQAPAARAADCGREDCSWGEAVAYCRGLGKALPTEQQLMKAWEDKCLGGRTSDLCSGWYWTGRENTADQAWGVSFRTGYVNSYKKSRRTQVYCGPGKKTAAGTGAAKTKAAAPSVTPTLSAGGGTGPCASGRCTWYQAADYCRSQGTRLINKDELKLICLRECPPTDVNFADKAGEGCNRWLWLDKSLNADFANSGSCSPVAQFVTNSHSAAKTSQAYARCIR